MSRLSPRRSRKRRVLAQRAPAIAAGLLVVVAGAGAAMFWKPNQVPPIPPLTAVLVGSGVPASAQKAGFEAALRHGEQTAGRLFVGPLDGSTRDVVTDLAGQGGFDLERKDNLEAARTAARQGFDEAVRGGSPGFALSGLRNLALDLNEYSGRPVDVLIVGNTTRLAEGVDLNDPIVRGDPKATVDSVAARGLLPNCTGWRVGVVGGSRAGTAAYSNDFDVQAQEFWRVFVDRCGGRLTGWNPNQLATFPARTPVAAVTFGPDCGQLFSLAGQAVFDSGRSRVKAAAGTLLTRLSAAIGTGSRVTVQGHTDSTGVPAENVVLSRARAEAVKAWLVRQGIPAGQIEAQGLGSRDPVAANSTPAGRQLNRRVDVHVTSPPEGCR